MENNELIISIKDLSKTFDGITVLSHINLDVYKGDIYGVLGLSGAGKSTLVRCLNGLEKYDSGEVYFKNELVKFDRSYRRKVSMIFQSFNLLEQKNVLKNVELADEINPDSKLSKEERRKKASDLLKLVGLEDKLKAYPSQLSGGQKQRVAIARSLMTDPEVLLSDEATSALDPDTTKAILELLRDLNKKLGLTIIIISHQMEVIESICNKVAIIDHSEIVENGSVYDIFLSPKTKIAKKLIYSKHLVTRLDEEKMIKLIFNGEVNKPLISNIVQDCNILVSIEYADTRTIEGKVYGQIVFNLPYYDSDIEKLKRYLELNKINYEEVSRSELE